MKRIYHTMVVDHFARNEQILFLSGPRQVGKTTIAKSCSKLTDYFKYLNWDKILDREQILLGENAALNGLPMHTLLEKKPIIVFDEIHKYKHWRTFLKGLIDEYKGDLDVLVTGSAKLNLYRRGADSLMGRYFNCRVHPFSIAEMNRTELPSEIISLPKKIQDDKFQALFEFGGFPEPLIKQDKKFYNQWQNLRQEQMIREDIRDLAHIQELAQLEVLAIHLQQQTGQLIEYSNLAKKIRVSDQTIRRWITVLESFFYCFTIKPWSSNISRTLIKQPKIYLWDWSQLQDRGAKVENFVASHLLKAIHFWTDIGFGKYELYFLRDKDKHEVDFLITQNQKPWMMVEVKNSGKEPLSPSLLRFQSQINAPHVFQVAFDMPYIEKNCFSLKKPMIVPMKTFLSQLI
jgi:predicted AAA+ superfamily ATPase